MNLEAMDKEYVLQTYTRNYVNFKHGMNATLFDENGRDYIDFTSGIGVVSVGHGNMRLADAIAEQARHLIHTSNLYMIEPQAKLAKKINDNQMFVIPESLEMSALEELLVGFGIMN